MMYMERIRKIFLLLWNGVNNWRLHRQFQICITVRKTIEIKFKTMYDYSLMLKFYENMKVRYGFMYKEENGGYLWKEKLC